jgi:DNA-directed RNA polymerase specialized sigma24 family protein
MNRLFAALRRPADPAADRDLLRRFLTDRDEAAFAELVRRYGPAVWAACRRHLPTPDAEDAFQATFLVFVRRAGRLTTHPAVGPWLYRVAMLTARNLARGNRRRSVRSAPLPADVPVTVPPPVPDLDSALMALPDRLRVPVILCHLHGLTRREAASRLGCPEGTLSAQLAEALKRLRSRLGRDPAMVLAVAGSVAVPTVLAASTTRAAVIYATSSLAVAGVSPAVAGLTRGVLRMFWMKKLTAAAVVAGGLFAAGVAMRSDGATAADPPPAATVSDLERKLDELRKQKEVLDKAFAAMEAEKAKIDAEKADKEAAKELGANLAVEAAADGSSYTVKEVVNGKVRQVTCWDAEMLTAYLARTYRDPASPRALRVYSPLEATNDVTVQALLAGKSAGYATATLYPRQAAGFVEYSLLARNPTTLRYVASSLVVDGSGTLTLSDSTPDSKAKPTVIDLRKYEPKKK